ncbi:MAG: topoisomerase C-terminal repeat-containing protein [Clostridia bacterium]|nr:topoisomerase C-terminal repeat-containing protein [Clostridia bacterium]
MILIIAEKPSLARNIGAGIGKMASRNGYLEGNGYLITWAFGHLFSLADIEYYSPSPDGTNRWTMQNLPCFPKEFVFELKKDSKKQVDAGIVKQFNIIKQLCNRPDVDMIVNAGDADREGEIIVRLCIQNALDTKKEIRRLWLPDQTPQTVAKALTEMKPDYEYNNLANEGLARTYIDWLYGVNLTRYATLKTGTLLRVGRVIVPIVKAIYDRDMAIKNFVPETYYIIASKEFTNGEVIELNGKEKIPKDQIYKAQELCDKYNASTAVVTNVKRKKETLHPGKLYSLSKLQNVLGKKYKMSMKQSLDIIQKLYENGYLTYPRTNSEYLATTEQGKVKTILENCKKIGYPVEFKFSKKIFDDSKIESHSALTPTYKIPDSSKLTPDELKVYSTVFRRFIAVFCAEECIVERSEITIKVGEYEEFSIKGTVIVQKGWTKYDDYNQKDKILPKLTKGDIVNINFKPVEKETAPPRHYTIETLNNYLKNPFKEDKATRDEKAQSDDTYNADDSEDYKAIFEGLELGTEATRTGIIDNARNSQYINLNKDVYTILPGGIFMIESLIRMNINMDKYKTSQLGQALKKVYRGQIEIQDAIKLTENELSEIFDSKDTPIELDTDSGFFGDMVGKCPLCGGDVKRMKYNYCCMNYKEQGCKFSVGTIILGRSISKSNVQKLLSEGKTSKIQGFTSKNGKKFDAFLKLQEGKVVFDF